MFKFLHAVSAELKNQRVVFYSAALLAAIVYALFHLGPWRKPNIEFFLFHFIGSLIFLAFAATAGSLAFRQDRTIQKASLPTCLIKLIISSLSAIIAGFGLVIVLALSVQFDRDSSFLGSFYPDFYYFSHSVTYFSGGFLVYACSILFSSFLARTWRSALAGFAIGATILFATASFWVRLDRNIPTNRKLATISILIQGLLLLLLSWISLRKINFLRSSIRLPIGILAILVMSLVASALVLTIRPSPAKLELGWIEPSPRGTEIVTNAYGESDQQVWMISTNSGGGSRVIGRHAYNATFSPNGGWIVFFSQESLFGLRSFYVSLRAAKTDGTEERILLPNFTRWYDDEIGIGTRGRAFSPDSKYVALLSDTALYVVDLEGKLKTQAAIPLNSDKELLGWRPNGLQVLLLDKDRKCIETYDLRENQFRTVYGTVRKPNLLAPTDKEIVRHVLLGNELIDLERGNTRLVSDTVKKASPLATSIFQDTLIYSINDYYKSAPSAYIHVFDIETGRDEVRAKLNGAIDRLIVSPDGSRIAIELWTASRQPEVIVMNGNSVTCKFKGWGLVGWKDLNIIILRDDRFSPNGLALGEIAAGRIQQFYP